MSQVINTNVGSLNAQNALNSTQNASKVAMERLASGKSINRAADNAAGLAIGEAMTAQIKGTNMAIKNTNDGISFVQTAEGALNEVSTMLQRVRELAVQNENGTLTDDQRGYLDAEFTALTAEITNVVNKTEFNDQAILNQANIDIQTGWEDADTMAVGIGGAINTGNDALDIITNAGEATAATNAVTTGGANTITTSGALDELTLKIKVDGGVEQTYTFSDTSANHDTGAEVIDLLNGENGLDGVTATYVDNALILTSDTTGSSSSIDITGGTANAVLGLGTASVDGSAYDSNGTDATGTINNIGASDSLEKIDAALDFINTKRSTLGAQQNRLEHNASNLANVSENMSAARSQIMDADFAAESAELARTNVLQQAGMSMLAQANQAPNNILALVR